MAGFILVSWSGQAELNRYHTHPKGTYCRYTMARLRPAILQGYGEASPPEQLFLI